MLQLRIEKNGKKVKTWKYHNTVNICSTLCLTIYKYKIIFKKWVGTYFSEIKANF
jgi:hypothetical protein